MAKHIVTQIPKKCKVKVNPYVDSVAESLKAKPELHYRRAGEVLSMTNEDAIEFLRSVGFSQIIPGTHFAPLRDYARFLDVQSHILSCRIDYYKLGNQNNSQECFSTTLKRFFKVAGLLSKGEILSKPHKAAPFDFRFTKTDSHYVTEDSYSVRFVSARVVVAMIPIMASKNGSHYKERCRTLNDELIKFLRQKNDQAQAIAEAEAAARVAAEAKAEARKEADLKAALAEETLYQLIKRAVVEVMSGAHISLAAPTVNT